MKGAPGILLIKGLPNGFQDALAIELKNPNGKGTLFGHQKHCHNTLKHNCNVSTMIRNNYDDVVVGLYKHYEETPRRALDINANPQTHDFSTNGDSEFWARKLQRKKTCYPNAIRGISRHVKSSSKQTRT